jgi:hypothetical protein
MKQRKIITTHETFIKQCVLMKQYLQQTMDEAFKKRAYIARLRALPIDEVRNERDVLHARTPEL